MKINKLYFDMDGVLADFCRGIRELCRVNCGEQGQAADNKDDEMWRAVKKVDHFYDKLELMPGALDLFKKIRSKYGDKVEILTGIPKPKRGITTAGADKTNWSHRILDQDLVVNIVFSEEKKNYVKGPGYILIDDLEKNIADWRDAGGIGILFKSAEDALEQIKMVENS